MTSQELPPDAADLLRSLIGKPHSIPDSPLLQLPMADRLVMGSPAKVHITALGNRVLVVYEAARLEPDRS